MRQYSALASNQQLAMQRIQNELAEFLAPSEARDLAAQVEEVVFGIDQNINCILEDPLVKRLFDYDGKFFTPRGSGGLHMAFDGLHVLTSLGNWIHTLFNGRPKDSAIRAVLEEIHTHDWLAKRRRMNWQGFGTLGVIPEQTIKEILADLDRRAEADPSPLSPEELAFFRSFEEQLEAEL